jgi:hypothetical protein
MNSWHKVTRSDWRIQDDFSQVWLFSGGPKSAALFALRNQQARTTDFYLTPTAVALFPDLLEKYGTIECKPPNTSSLAFLEGDQSATEGNGY